MMNPKKVYNRLIGYLSILIVMMVGSCNVIDIEPVSDFTDANFWQTRVQAEGAIYGIYDAMQALGDDFLAYGEARGDLLQPGWGFCCNEGVAFGQLQRNEITDANNYTQWAPFYNVINRANVVIAKAPGIIGKDAEFTEVESNFSVGEARFLRALMYWWMARVWKDVPLLTEPTTATMDFLVRRTNQEAIINFVEAELNDIVSNQHLRPQFGNNTLTKSRATIAAGRALLAQVALWRNNYDVVVTQTTAIIGSTVPAYSLVGSPNWFSNFNPGLSIENIFELHFDAAQNDRNFPAYRLSAGVAMVPSTYLRDLHESPNNLDYRDNVRGNGKTWTWNNAYFRKWIGNAPQPIPDDRVSFNQNNRGDNLADPNFIFFRLADVYLMRAEAKNRLNDKQGAIDDLNFVRARALLPPATIVGTSNGPNPIELIVAASNDEIEDAIIQERAMELAGEGHRWFDLMRISKRGRSNFLPNMVNDGSKYSFAGAWQAWNDPAVRLANPVSADPNTWYLPVEQRNKITNPKLEEPPL